MQGFEPIQVGRISIHCLVAASSEAKPGLCELGVLTGARIAPPPPPPPPHSHERSDEHIFVLVGEGIGLFTYAPPVPVSRPRVYPSICPSAADPRTIKKARQEPGFLLLQAMDCLIRTWRSGQRGRWSHPGSTRSGSQPSAKDARCWRHLRHRTGCHQPSAGWRRPGTGAAAW